MRIISVAALIMLECSVPALSYGKRFQSCSGAIIQDSSDSSYPTIVLKPDKTMKKLSLCDATFNDSDLEKVLKVCPIGQRCHIEGTTGGHGVYFWTSITKVKKL